MITKYFEAVIPAVQEDGFDVELVVNEMKFVIEKCMHKDAVELDSKLCVNIATWPDFIEPEKYTHYNIFWHDNERDIWWFIYIGSMCIIHGTTDNLEEDILISKGIETNKVDVNDKDLAPVLISFYKMLDKIGEKYGYDDGEPKTM